MTTRRFCPHFLTACVALCAAGLTLSCDLAEPTDQAIDDGTQSQGGQALSLGGNALLVVGNATLSTSDSALRQRLQGQGLAVTVKTATAATAAGHPGDAGRQRDGGGDGIAAGVRVRTPGRQRHGAGHAGR